MNNTLLLINRLLKNSQEIVTNFIFLLGINDILQGLFKIIINKG